MERWYGNVPFVDALAAVEARGEKPENARGDAAAARGATAGVELETARPSPSPAPTPEPLADVCQRVEEQPTHYVYKQGVRHCCQSIPVADRDRLLAVARAADAVQGLRGTGAFQYTPWSEALDALEAAVRGTP
jgi:hypothetical protein